MKLPIRDITGHLIWTTDGRAHAVYRATLTGPARPSRRVARKLLDQQTGILKQLRGNPVLTSLCPRRDLSTIAGQMVDDVDLENLPEWAETVEGYLEMIADVEMIDRTHWLVLPLSDSTGESLRKVWDEFSTSVTGTFSDMLGLAPRPVRSEAIESKLAFAAEYVSRLHGIELRPASEAEIIWWIARAPRRGFGEPEMPKPNQSAPASKTRRGCLAALGDVILDECGKTDDHTGDLRRRTKAARSPRNDLTTQARLRRRYVKVMTEHGTSYQSFIMMSEMPHAWTFPGGEFFARLDDSGIGVDWQARLSIVPNAVAKDKARKQTRQLHEQNSEWDPENGAAPPSELANAQEEVDDLAARLGRSSTEVEVQAAIVMCVWAETPAEVNRRADLVCSIFNGNEYQVVRPMGGQADLFEAMLPGTGMPTVMKDYRQHLLAQDFATSSPFITHELGDPSGALLGLTLDGGLCRPMLWDISRGCRTNSSSSFAVVAELGAGKSVLLKSALFHTITRLRGRVVAIDRTASQEYIRFAEACPGTVATVPITETPSVSLDPLRVFAADGRRMHTLSFFNTLLDLPTTKLPGIVMDLAVSAAAARPDSTSSDVIAELDAIAAERAGSKSDEALVLAERLRHIAADALGAIIFDAALPQLQMDLADAMFFATNAVPLPEGDQLRDERAADRVDPRRLLGRALHVTIAAISREIAFKDSRFVLVLLDECYSITDSPDGQALVRELIRDGRKHYSAVGLGGHVVDNLGPKLIRNLITTRFLGRHTDPDLAADSLEWLIDADARHDADLVELVGSLSPRTDDRAVDEQRAGEFLVRHGKQVGALKVLIPPYRSVPDAIRTTPIGEMSPT